MSFAANFYLAAGIQANLHLPSSIHLPASIHTTNFYSIAATASERLLFSLGMGTLLAMVVWLLLRVFPKKDSRTSFAVWFATLLITAALPVASLYLSSPGSGAGTRAVITVPAAWAVYIFLAWAGVAGLGLARVAAALGQVRRIRRGSAELDERALHPELGKLVEEFRRSRAVTLLVSNRLPAPTALGFFHPAVVLPEWLLEETPAEELKYLLLHELEHLRRRDDWTNLAQQVVKALLFFVPSVWWIERRLALDREMACDDAVLAQSGTPRGYAECLARVAEKSFLRRQLALAQAAVSRLRHLTVRVSRILDPNRQKQTSSWKPAVPAVVVVAGLCAFSASQAPSLIGFAGDGGPEAAQHQAGAQPSAAAGIMVRSSAGKPVVRPAAMRQSDMQLKAVPASLKESSTVEEGKQPRAREAGYKLNGRGRRDSGKSHARARALYTLSNLHAASRIQRGPAVLAGLHPAQPQPEYVTIRQEFMMVVTQRSAQPGDAAPQGWQIHVVEISVTQSKPRKQAVPKKI